MEKEKMILGEASRIGIVNRGEAAVRFIRAVKEFNVLYDTNLTSVAFYLDHEQNALFVKEADVVCPLQGIPGIPSNKALAYTDKKLMIEALKSQNCQAVWVGWGFLAEDASFARMAQEAGIVFLGPSPESMTLLGDKIEAKSLARRIGVPILPWSERPLQDLDDATRMAQHIGYPVILKAAHAGGGRGIRAVRNEQELPRQYRSAREETLRITGDEVLFMEHWVEKGRHLEVQVAVDRFGHVRTYGVRDCSLQRRNQKIVEETPPPNLSSETIAKIEETASRLVLAAHYESVGTVEFLYDLSDNQFYFMEVNTRLQVEHPITEQIYQTDLVKTQLLIAMGKSIPEKGLSRGHCIEIRLNAEDPEKDFVPCPGKVRLYRIPAGPGIRVDSAVEEGSEIPPEFDSMIAKIIAYGENRKEALSRLIRALQEARVKIEGGTTNRAFLLALLGLDPIREGFVHTRFVEEYMARQDALISRKDWEVALVACAIEQYLSRYSKDLLNFKEESSGGYPRNLPSPGGHSVTVNVGEASYSFGVKAMGKQMYHLEQEGIFSVRYARRDHGALLVHAGRRFEIQMVSRGDTVQCEVNGVPYSLQLESCGIVRSPSPALVTSVVVDPGQSVATGDLLLTLEAMKMEIIVSAPQGGVVKKISVRKGEQVAAGQVLLTMEARSESSEAKDKKKPEIVLGSLKTLKKSEEWEAMEREFLALFLGYDVSKDAPSPLKRMSEWAQKEPAFAPRLARTFIEAMQIYVNVESLFSREKIEAEGFSHPVSYQELLGHYFRRQNEPEKGLPEKFILALNRAMDSYQGESSEAFRDHALFRIYKSHAQLSAKQKALMAILLSPEETLGQTTDSPREKLADLMDEIVRLSQREAVSLADAAVHARYHWFDKAFLKQMKEERKKKTGNFLISTQENEETFRQELLDSGPGVVLDLIQMVAGKGEANRRLGMEMLGRYFTRDRALTSFDIEQREGAWIAHVRSMNGTPCETLVVLAGPESDPFQAVSSLLNERSFDATPELIWLNVEPEKKEFVIGRIRESSLPVAWWCLGIVGHNKTIAYETFTPCGEADPLRSVFSPIFFRELRIDRLANFHLKLLYRSELVCVAQLTAKSNPKDERLFAFVEVPETRPELSDDEAIRRIIALEHVFMEAVYAIREQQAKRKGRLYWNRIIVHIRSFLKTSLRQIGEYATRMAPRTQGIGLERMIIYARRKAENQIEEEEFIFQTIANERFSVRRRNPSKAILEPMDKYVTRVIRARQTGNVYPYEIVTMLTQGRHAGNQKFLLGEFEEFDIVQDGEVSRAVSVAKRPYGKNRCNVVFGIITHYTRSQKPLKRILLLSDSTTDMGALAEQECRRVIAALDLADEQKIPVEWVPISAGARIDMESGTENLDWTARVLKRIIEFTQKGGEINVIVSGINVGAQSYWNSEATMLMHTRGILLMTDEAAMLLTGKKALDFSGSVSAEDNVGIGGVERIMGPNGEAQIWCKDLPAAYAALFRHYEFLYAQPGSLFPEPIPTHDPVERDVCLFPYKDTLNQGFTTIGDIFGKTSNPERKKPFDMRQVMQSLIDQDLGFFERWQLMQEAETAIVWESRLGGLACGLVGIESKPVPRVGVIPHDGPQFWNAGTLFPQSSKKVARAINAFSKRLPLVVLANLSGFDGSPESLRKCQLEFGAEIGRAVVNFRGPLVFVVVGRYHGGAYVVFSRALNPMLHSVALEGTYASVIGGAPAAAVVFPKIVLQETYAEPCLVEAQKKLQEKGMSQKEFDELFQRVYAEKQTALGSRFDAIHSVQRAKEVGSLHEVIAPQRLRAYLIEKISEGMKKMEETS